METEMGDVTSDLARSREKSSVGVVQLPIENGAIDWSARAGRGGGGVAVRWVLDVLMTGLQAMA